MPASAYLPAKATRIALAILCFWTLLMIHTLLWPTQSEPIFTSYPSDDLLPPQPEDKPSHEPNASSIPPSQKYAFATLLTGEEDTDNVEAPYFTAVRVLAYQLLHSPTTRSKGDIPFLVLVTADISDEQRIILTNDGATVVSVEGITREWIHPKWERWGGVLAKLNVWRMTDYEKIAFLDADSILFRPIDGVFEDSVSGVQETMPEMLGQPNGPQGTEEKESDDEHGEEDEEKLEKEEEELDLPQLYLTAGVHDPWVEQNLPPSPSPGQDFYVRDHYMNAGFFVLAPSEQMFGYYLALLDKPGVFDPSYPEQNLLNCAHRVDGRMPWRDIGPGWNMKGVRREDYASGLRSMHQKWWVPVGDEVLDGYVRGVVGEMRAFQTGVD
ncbi:nucleotide-diphospho-sugar transferase [Aspergillus karnatakaensis]|uniref:putative glycosyl transferase family 8 family n=1 Tax=Aspergillus karnatakaensis TaxID=1810916 RepID=UPI003CCE36E4